jgi:hypothetical protein
VLIGLARRIAAERHGATANAAAQQQMVESPDTRSGSDDETSAGERVAQEQRRPAGPAANR